MDGKRINDLIKKYIDETATDAEVQELNNWYRETAFQDAEFPQDENEVYKSILQNLNKVKAPKSTFGYFKKWAIAASILVFIGISITIYILKNKPGNTLRVANNNRSISDTNRAVLVLANGQEIYLNDSINGRIATQGNMQIAKARNGQLIYTIIDSSKASKSGAKVNKEIAYNTIRTPIGTQYQVILPDQSTVWLNSMSSLKFPVSFANLKERRVELTGEGYFKVTHNDKFPFRVITGALTIEDLGTSFNVQSYPDDANIKTTLIEGAASVSDGNSYSLLHPGEQAAYRNKIKISQVNIDEVIAWKNGYFRFEDDKLEDIMKSISRWYNIQYIFQDESLKTETYGIVSARLNDISVLLKMMEQTGTANFDVHGSTITISKKKNLK